MSGVWVTSLPLQLPLSDLAVRSTAKKTISTSWHLQPSFTSSSIIHTPFSLPHSTTFWGATRQAPVVTILSSIRLNYSFIRLVHEKRKSHSTGHVVSQDFNNRKWPTFGRFSESTFNLFYFFQNDLHRAMQKSQSALSQQLMILSATLLCLVFTR